MLFSRILSVVPLVLLFMPPALRGATLSEPEVLRWLPGEALAAEALPSWTDGVVVTGGRIEDGQWIVDAGAPIGEGRADLRLHPERRPLALAITFAFAPDAASDLAMQLYDANGALLAVDLFGNLIETARIGRSDTFIIPLSKYPDATRVSLRRLQGPLSFQGFVAFPVITELEGMSEADRATFARLLGESLAGVPGVAAGEEARAGGPSRLWIHEAKEDERLERLLAAPAYPEQRFAGTLAQEWAFPAYVSGTCYRFFTNLYLPLFGNPERLEAVAFVSSNSSNRAFLRRGVPVALSSYPPREAELATFEAEHGFRPMVLPIALDAVEVLVHPENQLDGMDFPTLRRIYSASVKAETGRLWWDAPSGVRGPILAAGGAPNWGTSRFFADRVMGGGAFRGDLIAMDVAYPSGVEQFIAGNRNAIGFAQHRRRTHAVKALKLAEAGGELVSVDALTAASGEYPLTRHLFLLLGYPSAEALPEPVRRFADRLLSKEGQRAVAAAGSYALSAADLRALRHQLKLDD